jgi:hypothetical protein
VDNSNAGLQSIPAAKNQGRKRFLWVAVLFAAVGISGFLTAAWFKQGHGNELRIDGPTRVAINHPDRAIPLEYTFNLVNPTSEPITIEQVICGCSCTVSTPSEKVIRPGGRGQLHVKIKSFDSFLATFEERIWVDTDRNRLELWITGTLPQPTKVLVRPMSIHVDSREHAGVVRRTIQMRIPQQFAKPLDDSCIELVDCKGVLANIHRKEPTELYQEFEIRMELRLPEARGVNGSLRVDAPGGKLEIPVRVVER